MKNSKLKQTIAALSAAAMLAAMPAAYAEYSLDDISAISNLTDVSQTESDRVPNYSYMIYSGENAKFGVEHQGDVVIEPVWDDINFGNNYFGGECVNLMSARELADVRKLDSVCFDTVAAGTNSSRFATYDEIAKYRDKVRVSVKKDGKWGCADVKTGELVIPCEYKEAAIDYNKIALLTADDKYAVSDLDGNMIVGPIYDYVQSGYSGSLTVVGRDYGYTVIDEVGRELLPLSENEPQIIGGKYITLTRDDEITEVYSMDGKKLFEKKASGILDYSDDIFVFNTGASENDSDTAFEICGADGATILSDSGKYSSEILLSTKASYTYIDNLYPFSDPAAKDLPTVIALRSSERDENGIGYYDYYDTSGKLLLSGYEAQGGICPSAVLITISKNGKIGFADRYGNIVREPQFDRVSGPIVTKNCKNYFMYNDGSLKELPDVGDLQAYAVTDGEKIYYEISGDFHNDGEYNMALMDSNGDFILPPIFHSMSILSGGLMRLYINRNNGVDKYAAKLADDPKPVDITPYITNPTLDESAQWFVDNGYVTGATAEELRTGEATTRAEFLALISRIDNWQIDVNAPAAFPDTEGHWANGIIVEAKNRGLITADESGNFDPDGVISYRGEYEILLREIGFSEEVSASANSDLYGEDAFGRYANISHSSSDPVPRLITFRILKGYNDEGRYYQFDPNKFGSEETLSDGPVISTSDSTDTYFFN